MGPASPNPLDLLTRKLAVVNDLSAAEQQAIWNLPIAVRTVAAHQDIVQEGGLSSHCCIILDGWTCCYQMLQEGRRQILSIHVPGDVPDLQSLHLSKPDFGMSALTKAVVAFVPHAALRRLMADFPALTTALWREALITSAIHRAWIVSLGRRAATGRLAHLYCELYLRLSATGSIDGRTMPMPLRQQDLADALGVTPVHVNRTLKDLRTAGLIALQGRRLEILDWPGLRSTAEFDAHYLQMAAEDHAAA